MQYTIDEITQLVSANRIGKRKAVINWLLTDSRSLSFPETTLFFAIRTSRNDGHKYIGELYEKGVYNFVVEESAPALAGKCPKANFLIVKDSVLALQKLAEQHRKRFPSLPVIGITGSNGKTIVKEWLYQLLGKTYAVTRSPRSYNSQIGVPLSVWQLKEDTGIGIFEAGISEPGEMDRLRNIISPTIGVLTNIGVAHQENFQSVQDKCMEKLSLFKNSDVIIYDGDDEVICDCVSRSMLAVREIAWSRVNKEKPLYIKDIDKQKDCTRIKYVYLGFEKDYEIPFVDDASINNSLNCLAVCLYLMLPPEEIKERMAALEPVAMRLEVKEGIRGCTIVNDSYNSDLVSLNIALDFIDRRSVGGNQKKVVILSDMLESGYVKKILYKKVGRFLEGKNVNVFIGVGQEVSEVRNYFKGEQYYFETTEQLLSDAVFNSLSDSIVLIKGARKFHFEDLADRLECKVHETILEINLDAIVANLNHYRAMLDKGTKVACMVKASAYGYGAYEVAKTLQDRCVDYLSVAVADEGADLRKAGITCPIMIMDPELSSFKKMFDNKLEPEVYSFPLLESLVREAEREGITDYPVHIKIDTGMHRLGFMPDEIPALVARLKSQSALLPRSVFSHFACSDDRMFDDFSRLQEKRFIAASAELQKAYDHKIIRHLCNTAGIERRRHSHFEMVRLGIGLYGIDPVDNSILNNVSVLKTRILQVKTLAAGEAVGYGCKGVLSRDSKIAAIPIGYADGLNRKLGNGNGYCLVNGRKAHYVGNICMDVSMIDVTGIDCREGDSVEIFGNELPVTVLSDILGTIPYEILTNVSQRVKRVYYHD